MFQQTILDEDNIQLARTQVELSTWVDEVVAAFKSTKEGREAYRLNRDDFIKKFSEELMPIKAYADAFYANSDDIKFRLVLGNGSVDAVAERSDGSVDHYLQVTLAADGYRNRLQMEHLTRFGHAPTTGPRINREQDGTIKESTGDSESSDELRQRELEVLRTAIKAKSDKRYERGTKLLAYFISDSMMNEEYALTIESFVRDELLEYTKNFTSLVFIGFGEGLPLLFNHDLV